MKSEMLAREYPQTNQMRTCSHPDSASTRAGDEQAQYAAPGFLRFFRWIALAMFIAGIVFVILPGFVLLFRNPPADGSFQKALWQQIGFLAGWVAVFFLIFRGTSVKPRRKLNDQRATVTFNMATDLRIFGVVFLGLSTVLGWVLFVQPLWSGQQRFHWAMLFFMALVVLFWVIGFACAFNVEWISLNSATRQYVYKSGMFPVIKLFRGDCSDFANLRIQREESTDSETGSTQYYWSLKLEWKDRRRKELELTKRPRGFEDLGRDSLLDITEVAGDLAQRLGLPLTKEETIRPL